MRKILYIVLGEISTGELGIAMSFVKQQVTNKYENHFIIPQEKVRIMYCESNWKVYLISRKKQAQENQRIIKNIILEQRIDLIILFDAFTFEYAQNWTGINFAILKEMRIPIASLDEYEYTKAGYKLDYYGIFIKRLPNLLDKCDYVIKNCPLSMPITEQECLFQGNKKNEFYYRVFQPLHRISKEEKLAVKRQYVPAIRKKTKLIFFTTSKWEVQGAYSFTCQNRLVTWLGVILHEYLKELDEEVVLLHIGTEKWNIPRVEDKVTYIHYDSLKVDKFEKILQAADLFITFNTVSITLTKAVMFGVPSIVLNNSKIIEFSRLQKKLEKRPQWYQDMALDVKKIYPFTASMFGWSNFLQSVIKDNLYMETFERIDMFNYKKTKEVLRKMLMDEMERQNIINKGKEFLDSYLKIKSSEDILEAIFQSK